MIFAIAAAGQIFATVARYPGGATSALLNPAEFKLFAFQEFAVATNPLAYAVVLSAGIATPVWARSVLSRWAFGAAFLGAVVLAGSRTTIMAALAAATLIRVARLQRRLRMPARVALWALCGGVFAAASWLTSDAAFLDPYEASRVTTGRLDLWIAGFRNFAAHPLFGAGAGAWRFELAGALPDYTRYGRDLLVESVTAGGYHNAYLTLLADRGVLCAVPAGLVLRCLGQASRRATEQRMTTAAPTASRWFTPKFALLFMVLRGFGEHSGLFGSADGAADFWSFGTAAVIIALAAERHRVERISAGPVSPRTEGQWSRAGSL
jgi:O-antigen ligase